MLGMGRRKQGGRAAGAERAGEGRRGGVERERGSDDQGFAGLVRAFQAVPESLPGLGI